MKQFDKDIYLIDPHVLESLLRQPPINPQILLDGIKSQSIKGKIILSMEELKYLFDSAYMAGYNDTGASLEDYFTVNKIQI